MTGENYKELDQFKGEFPNWNCSETELTAPKGSEGSSLEDSKQHLDAYLSRLVWMNSEVSSYVTLYSGYVLFVSSASILWGVAHLPLHTVGGAVSQGIPFIPRTPGHNT